MTEFISRILAIIMTLISIIMPVKPNNTELTVKEMTAESSTVAFTCVNNTGRRIDRPDVKCIEKKVDGQWKEVDVSFVRTDIGYSVNPGMECTDSVSLCRWNDDTEMPEYVTLSKGEYRMTVVYAVSGTQGQSSAEFTVK